MGERNWGGCGTNESLGWKCGRCHWRIRRCIETDKVLLRVVLALRGKLQKHKTRGQNRAAGEGRAPVPKNRSRVFAFPVGRAKGHRNVLFTSPCAELSATMHMIENIKQIVRIERIFCIRGAVLESVSPKTRTTAPESDNLGAGH